MVMATHTTQAVPRTRAVTVMYGKRELTLLDDAATLCHALAKAYWRAEQRTREFIAQDGYDNSSVGIHIAAQEQIARLWRRAADRWRRRHGLCAIYRGTKKLPPKVD